ncbi:hypothetical protein ACHAWF_018571 [Thalassiosira exigua]
MSSSDQPAAFPRGKRPRPPQPKGGPTASAKAPSSSEDRASKRGKRAGGGGAPSAARGKDEDFLFGGGDALKTDKNLLRRRKRRDGGDDDDAPLGDDPDDDRPAPSTSDLPLGGGSVVPPSVGPSGRRVPARIESLTFSKFAKGTKVLGVIREVAEEYALVSLPAMLTGYVRREEGGEALTRVLPPVGSAMGFAVASVGVEEVSKRQQKKDAAAGGAGNRPARRRRIELSPHPAHVNAGVRVDEYLSPLSGSADDDAPMVVRGRITSVEDHGCIVDLGGLGRRAFLKFENVEGGYKIDDDDDDSESDDDDDDESDDNNDEDDDDDDCKGKTDAPTAAKRVLNRGRVYDFAILPSNVPASSKKSSKSSSAGAGAAGGALQLSLPSFSSLCRLRAPSSATPSLSSLLPGTLVEARVESRARNGLCVTFRGGTYRGSLDEDHLGGRRRADDDGKGRKEDDGGGAWWRSVFKGRHAKFVARIVAVDVATKLVRLSIAPHILALDGSLATFPYQVGDVVKNARVIRADPGIGALLALPPPNDESAEGASAHDEAFARLDKELGNRLLEVPEYQSASRVAAVYVHISKSMDVDGDSKAGKKGKQKKKEGTQGGGRTPEALFARNFPVSKIVPKLRILSTSNPFEGVASCATAKSIVNAHVLTHADVVPGRLYKDVPVLQLLDSGGALVDLGCGVRGIVPAIHLFDRASHGVNDASDSALGGYRQKVRLAKYKPGNVVTVRCLSSNPAAKSCVLTAKKTLVSSNLGDEPNDGPIADYTSIKEGRVAAGFITKVDDMGLTVTFYNNVHGRVSSRSLARELGVEDVRTNYGLGDAVLARVVGCERRRNRNVRAEDDEEAQYYYRLTLSLKTVVEEEKKESDREGRHSTVEDGDEKKASALTAVPLVAGSLLPPKRMKVLQLVKSLIRDDGASLPGYAIVAIKSKFLTSLPSGSADAVEFKLPYDQIIDTSHSDQHLPMGLDNVAAKSLTVGKRIDAEGLVLAVPGGDAMPITSLRQSLISTIKTQQEDTNDDYSVMCPTPRSSLFAGRHVRGYVHRIDPRYGAFVRFLDGLTGLIPKLKGGCDVKLYEDIFCRVTALDITSSPPKILLKKVSEKDVAKKKKKSERKGGVGPVSSCGIRVGDVVGDVKVADVNFARATVYLLDNDSPGVRARIHVTMASPLHKKGKLSKKERISKEEHKLGKCHPFYRWKAGEVIEGVRCVAVDVREGVSYVELSNMTIDEKGHPLPILSNPSHAPPGSFLSAIVTSISTVRSHHGLWVQVCPGISGFVPALELSTDPGVLNDLETHYEIGSRIQCCVMEEIDGKRKLPRPKLQADKDHDDATRDHHALELSVLLLQRDGNDAASTSFRPVRPHRGDLVAARVDAQSRAANPPSLALALRGGVAGRCCVTELEDVGGWENMPLGKTTPEAGSSHRGETNVEGSKGGQRVVSSDSDAEHSNEAGVEDDSDGEHDGSSAIVQIDYPDGRYVTCRVLGHASGGGGRSKGTVELSLRGSRCAKDGNISSCLEKDPTPKPGEMSHAYVVSTTKKGCFIRLSRYVEGRVILKELSDSFVPNPVTAFPPGRLVVGKVKGVRPSDSRKRGSNVLNFVDMDLRESVLLAGGDRVTWNDVKEHSKYAGVVTRVESYGVFVRIENSDVTGLAHVSECSDSFVKNIFDLYNPGDLVKVIVISVDKEQTRLGLSLKASNFVDDDDEDSDSDDKSSSSSDSSSDAMEEDDRDEDDEQSLDSEDEDFASKLAKKMESGADGVDVDDPESADSTKSSDDDGSSSGSESESSDSEDEESEEKSHKKERKENALQVMETDVGFDWGTAPSPMHAKARKLEHESSSSEDDSSSSDESDEDDDADSGFKSSHRSRKKAAAKRREEEETSRREAALADGTADDAPETSADFERLVASSPNNSEVWIRYMAFHLSLADIESARNVAGRAFDRIEFRQEGEKLNVWTALLTLELKYGTDRSLHEAIDRACQQNNPKHVYLRVCELLEKEVDTAVALGGGANDLEAAASRADNMFTKMCKKFKSKKSVWLAHFKYLLKGSRHEEAHALLKRSLQSLPTYKHVEVMSKFAQMEFELGSPERGRTIFDALLQKHPKRMDLLFVNIDKEVKNGNIVKARALFDSVVNPTQSGDSKAKFKFSDKQMKSLFKKWYRMEDDHGDKESLERVKEEAKAFVAKVNP